MPLSLDSWSAKFAILGLLLVARYALTFKVQTRSSKAQAFVHSGRELLDSALLTLGLVFLLMQPFIAQAYYIPSGSMESTLPIGDRILTSRWVYRVGDPKFRDVVVFEAPDAALASSGLPKGTDYVKRCIGTPGDVIEIRDRQLYRNGQLVKEPYTRWSEGDDAQVGRFSYDMKIVGQAVYSRRLDPFDVHAEPGPWTQSDIPLAPADQAKVTAAAPGRVPIGKIFVLGDHRNFSSDGHVWGFVPRENVLGKAFAVFWPPRDWGVVDRKSAP